MRGRLVVFALAIVLSGCVNDATKTNTPPPGQDVSQVADASALLPKANDIAAQWSQGATLGLIVGSEGAVAQPDDPPYSYDTRADPSVGDGLALAWTFMYFETGASSAYAVTLGGDGSVLYSHTVTGRYAARPADMPGLVPPFTSSHDAASLVLGNRTSQDFVAEHPTSSVHMTLAASPRGPQWFYLRSTATGFMLEAQVDAANGTLLQIRNNSQPRIMPMPTPVSPCNMSTSCRAARPPSPPLPPDEDASKNSTLNAFNQRVDFSVMPGHFDFAYDLKLTIDIPGTSPIDDRTLTVTDSTGYPVFQTTGTGRFVVPVETNGTQPGQYRVSVTADAPPARDQVISFASHLNYTRYVGYNLRSMTSGSGTVGYQQTSDQTLRLPANASVSFRITFATSGPNAPDPAPTNATTWALLDPQGDVVAHGSAPGGAANFTTATTPNSYTLRVTGGTDAVFGENYRYTAATSQPPQWA